MVDVTLVPMTAADLDDFIREQVADSADEGALDGRWSRCDAHRRAAALLHNVIAWERGAMTDRCQRLWTALTTSGEHVGWLWVKLAPPGPAFGCAFLCQMTVARTFRRHGYGQAMLAALEARLIGEGLAELHLNVCEANLPAKCLYASAGFTCAAQFPTMRQLHKRLDRENPPDVAMANESCDRASPARCLPE